LGAARFFGLFGYLSSIFLAIFGHSIQAKLQARFLFGHPKLGKLKKCQIHPNSAKFGLKKLDFLAKKSWIFLKKARWIFLAKKLDYCRMP